MAGKRTIAALAGLTLVVLACRKDPGLEDPAGKGPTPAEVDMPQWVKDSLGDFVPHAANPLTVEGIALGRRLFYDKRLSNDHTQSCASCHAQANAFTDVRPFSIGTDGSAGTRNAMAVINPGWDHRFFWDGRAGGLESQALGPVVNPIEMRNTWPVVMARLQADPVYVDQFEAAFGTRSIDSILVVKAIAQFERTFISFGTRFDRFYYQGDSGAFNEQEMRGLDLFMRDGHCVDCHHNELLSDHSMRNNGLDMMPADGGLGALTGNPGDWGRFKVPTLRNIAVTAPYMHDSRFSTLEEVVHFYANDVQLDAPYLDDHMDPWRFGQVDLDDEEEADLVAFLRTLTDSTFLTNPAFGPP